MDNNFSKAFEIVIGHEGGYVDDPQDRGGETKFGISKRSYPDVDIKNLTLQDAKEIYYKDFWNVRKMNLDHVPLEVAVELFDTGVNIGSSTTRKMLQKALNLLNRVETRFADIKMDGWIGKETLRVLKMVDQKELLKVLNGLQFVRYLEIVERDHTQERFFAGWIKRT